jgi:hypothetical protein
MHVTTTDTNGDCKYPHTIRRGAPVKLLDCAFALVAGRA